MNRPPEQRGHPQVQSDVAQAQSVLQDHVQKLENQTEPLNDSQKKELTDAKTTLSRLPAEKPANTPDSGKETPPAAHTQTSAESADTAHPKDTTLETSLRPRAAEASHKESSESRASPHTEASLSITDPNLTPPTAAEAPRNHGDPQGKTRPVDTSSSNQPSKIGEQGGTVGNQQPSPAIPSGKPSTPPLSVPQSRKLLENVSRLPVQAQQHPTTRANTEQARQVVADHVQKLENQPSPLSEGQKKELENAHTALARLAPDVRASVADPQSISAGKKAAMHLPAEKVYKSAAERRKENAELLDKRPKRKSPPSNEAQVVGSDAHAQLMRTCILLQDYAHDDGDLERVSLGDDVYADDHDGEYTRASTPGKTAHIGVRPDSGYPMLITLHELGHNVMESLRPEDVDAIFKAAYKTQHQLAAQIAGAKKLDYWFHPEEVFARAYAQFVVQNSPNREALNELTRVINSDYYWTQWDESEWPDVEREIIKALKNKNWL